MSGSALLECSAVSCGYHGIPVLEGLDLRIEAGEVVALLGPNGSGKTTILKSIVKEITTLKGRISLGGDPIGGLSTAEMARRVAVVPQEETPAFAFTVRETVTLGRLARSTGMADSAADVEAATEAMRTADCLDLADRSVTELSGGERQRVLIARALAQDTGLLLLDEPTSHLDPLHQVQVGALIRALAEEGRGLLAAVHDLNLAAEIANRALLLGPGGRVTQAPMGELLEGQALEEAYGVRFERLRSEDGTVIVRPKTAL